MKKLKSLILIALSVASMGAFVACSDTTKSDNKEAEKRTVTTMKGDVEIPANPQRIVDISGSSEDLAILGYTPVGTANIDSYDTTKVPSYMSDKFKDTKVVGHSMMETMDMEAILSCNPDLIIMSQRQEKIYDQLKDIAPTVMIKDYANDWRDRLTDIGKLFEKEDVAKTWLENYDKKAEELGKEIIAKKGNETYLPVLASPGNFFVFTDAGIGSILYDDMKLAKPKNMPKQEGISLPQVTMEGLTGIDADNIVVIADESNKKDLEASKVWSQIRAVKNGNVVMLNTSPYFTQVYNPIGKELILESIKNELVK